MDIKELSKEVSAALDILGFRLEMIKWRRYCYLCHSDALSNCVPPPPASLCGLNFKPVLTGSKKEGTSIWHQSDEDFMLIIDRFVCSPTPVAFKPNLLNKVWLKLESDKRSPGYVCLHRTWRTGDNSNTALHKFLDIFMKQLPDGSHCLSSRDFNKMIYDAYNEANSEALQGKHSLPEDLVSYIKIRAALAPTDKYRLKINSEGLTLDVVGAFPCFYPALILQWKERKRVYGWPNKDTINRVGNLPGHVVAKGSNLNEHLQFRISYTFGEIELVKSFNEVQLKLYVLLKKLLQLEPICSDIFTSYVIKNTIFWVCEESPQDSFKHESLLEMLLVALDFILQCVYKENLPCYFIPERNLFRGKISTMNKQTIIDQLLGMVSEGTSVVLRINEVHREVLRLREDRVMALLTGHFRNLAEIFCLSHEKSYRHFILTAIQFISSESYQYVEKKYFS